jgi:L1 cell adhesion molecule like protein
MADEVCIGIDLGTSNSCVGYWVNDRVEIIPNEQGNRTTPSYVAFTDTGRLIGEAAKNQTAMNPCNTVFDAKRLIGRRYAHAGKGLFSLMSYGACCSFVIPCISL